MILSARSDNPFGDLDMGGPYSHWRARGALRVARLYPACLMDGQGEAKLLAPFDQGGNKGCRKGVVTCPETKDQF